MALTRTDIAISLLGIAALGLWLIPPLFPNEEEKNLRKEARQPLQCTDAEHCDRYWLRAKQWIHDHSEHRIVWEAANVIDTFNPPDSIKRRDNSLSYKVFKKVRRNTTVIDIDVDCNHFFDNCDPSPVAARVAFKRYVRD